MNKLQLVNLALSKIGETPLSALTENRPAALAVEAVYEPAKRKLLSLCCWPWAAKKLALARSLDTVDGWTYCFALPADCIRPFHLSVPGVSETGQGMNYGFPPVQWEQVGNLVCTELDSVVLRYVSDVDVSRFPADAADLFAIRLAADIASSLSRDPGLALQLDQLYYREAQVAQNRALKSDRRHRDEPGEYVNARQGTPDKETLEQWLGR